MSNHHLLILKLKIKQIVSLCLIVLMVFRPVIYIENLTFGGSSALASETATPTNYQLATNPNMIMPLSGTSYSVGTFDELESALLASEPTINIILTSNIIMEKQLAIRCSVNLSGGYTLFLADNYIGSRHFEIWNNATLTLADVTLDGSRKSVSGYSLIASPSNLLIASPSNLLIDHDANWDPEDSDEWPWEIPIINDLSPGAENPSEKLLPSSSSLVANDLDYSASSSNTYQPMHAGNYDPNGGVYIDAGGKLILDGGKIIKCSEYFGGAVFIVANAEFIMNEGEISENLAAYGSGVYANGNFIMNGGTITNCGTPIYGSEMGGGVYVATNASFTMNSGEISNCGSNQGGGVYVSGNSEFNMVKGTIGNCSARNTGGGIYVQEDGEFTMNYGNITDCSAEYGGGVGVAGSGKFVFSSGTIDKCNANMFGGGIYIQLNAIFEFISGSITKCTSKEEGGGIYISIANDFKLSSGTISECTSHSGGGIFITSDNAQKTFTLAGNAIIEGCTTVDNYPDDNILEPTGAGIFIKNCTLSITGGKISGCQSGAHGGGIDANDNSVIELNCAQCESNTNHACELITDCQALKGHGGAIYSRGVVKLINGRISNCRAENSGGGIYMVNTSESKLSMINGIIDHCTARLNGGGVYLLYGSTLNMSGGVISNCNAKDSGDGIAIVGGSMIMGIAAQDDTNSPRIINCDAGILDGNIVEWYGGWGGGIFAKEGGSVTINSGVIDNCQALQEPPNDGYAGNNIHGSGGGIFLELTGTADISQAWITNCTASYHGGGIFTRKYSNLTTTEKVNYSGNRSEAFYRKPATLDPSNTPLPTHSCEAAGDISLSEAELGRKSPLNNYDINLFSISVLYIANGGQLKDATNTDVYEAIYELVPFETYNDIPSTYEGVINIIEHPTLFEFEWTGARFGTWANNKTYIPYMANGYTEYDKNDVLKFSIYELISTMSYEDAFDTTAGRQYVRNIYAQWFKTVTIKKEVVGSLGNREKEFPINVTFRNADGDELPDKTKLLPLKHGQSESIEVYNDWSISVIEDLTTAASYTADYLVQDQAYDGDYIKDLELSEITVDQVPITVKNTMKEVVPTGIRLQTEYAAIAAISMAGIIMYFIFLRCSAARRKEQ